VCRYGSIGHRLCAPQFDSFRSPRRRGHLATSTNHANLRENRCDARCYWRAARSPAAAWYGYHHRHYGDHHRTILDTMPTIVATIHSATTTTLGAVANPRDGTLRPPQRAAFFFHVIDFAADRCPGLLINVGKLLPVGATHSETVWGEFSARGSAGRGIVPDTKIVFF
jgi:hypothetical protein